MRKQLVPIMGTLVLSVLAAAGGEATQPEGRWWKGNLHTHTFWSDGRDYPEMVVEWYKTHGYHFLALSDHNIIPQGSKWITVDHSEKRAPGALDKYVKRFGESWVQKRIVDGIEEVRIKPLGEVRCLFEEPDRFLLIQAEEIGGKAAHVGGVNLLECIPIIDGDDTVEVMQSIVDAVLAQRERTGQMMFPHINHPNFRWALTAEEIMQIRGAQFFEVYNGHPSVYNTGDEMRAGTERMWDIILAKRLAELNLPIMYAIATDDTHEYRQWGPGQANPGRGWIMVRAERLTPESLITAMEKGDFYSSTGVVLKDIKFNNDTLTVEVEPQKDVTYKIQFIGTRRGYDRAGTEVTDADGNPLRTTKIYSSQIGEILKGTEGTTGRYTLAGDEIYVRAKVISSRFNETLSPTGEFEAAWVQPVKPDTSGSIGAGR